MYTHKHKIDAISYDPPQIFTNGEYNQHSMVDNSMH